MQTAQGKYTLAGRNLTIIIYFDYKAFDLITPSLNSQEVEDFIYLICDSFAAALSQQAIEKHFYIKRVFKKTDTQTLKLLCTDGFLIDNNLILPISQQAFPRERIKISEIEQLPTRFNLSNEMIRNINERLFLFEESARNELPQIKTSPSIKTINANKFTTETKEFSPEKNSDVLSELGNIKKEIKEMSEYNLKILKNQLDEIDSAKKNIHAEITKEARQQSLGVDEKPLEIFTTNIMSQFDEGEIKNTKETLIKKITEVRDIPKKFETEFENAGERIAHQNQTLATIKQKVIDNLYESAFQYQQVLLPQIKAAQSHAKKLLITEFNKKFNHIAALSDTGEITSPDVAKENLYSLSFEDIQDIISKEDKDNPGLLQMCNTSWTEESPELKIVVKNLNELNKTLSLFFKDDTQFSTFANKEMIKITRIPFPRSFQFKFTQHFFDYKNAIDAFSRKQKDNISELSQQYKKVMQLTDIVNKTRQELSGFHEQADKMKAPLSNFKDLLKRQERAAEIITSVNQEFGLPTNYLNLAKQLLLKINEKHDNDLNQITPKLTALIHELQVKVNEQNKALRLLTSTKNQIDSLVEHASSETMQSTNLNELDDKIKFMENFRGKLNIDNNLMNTIKDKLDLYENAYELSNKNAWSNVQTEIKNKKTEAKNLLLQFIQNQTNDVKFNETLKKNMIEAYSHLDMSAASADKIIEEFNSVKSKLISDLSQTNSFAAKENDDEIKIMKDKWQTLEAIKNDINLHLEELKQLSLQAREEKKL